MMPIKMTKSWSYSIIKDSEILHQDIINALAKDFNVEIIDEIKEDAQYSSPKLIIRKKNGLEEAVSRAKDHADATKTEST